MITNGASGDFRGIGLVEVLCKALTSLLNCRLAAAIKFHDVLHGFWAFRGTGTATLEAKLLQHLTSMREAVLFEVFLDLQKAYDALDWYICLEIISAYRVGHRTLRLFRIYWDRLIMLARAGGYFGLPLKWYHGLKNETPCPPRSPMWSWMPSSATG